MAHVFFINRVSLCFAGSDTSVARRERSDGEGKNRPGKFYERGGGLLVSLASSANTRKVDISTIKRSVSL